MNYRVASRGATDYVICDSYRPHTKNSTPITHFLTVKHGCAEIDAIDARIHVCISDCNIVHRY